MPAVRVAVIGTGRIGYEHLRCLKTLGGVEVVAVCDRSPVLAQIAAERHGVRAWYGDYRDLLGAEQPDVVHIATPATTHLPIALDTLAAGAHIIVEKPIAQSPQELDRLLRAARAGQRLVVENLSYVLSKSVQRICRYLEAGTFGDVVHVDVTLAAGIAEPGSPFSDPHVRHHSFDVRGGPIADFLPHMATVVCLLTGPHRRVEARWQRRTQTLPADELRASVVGQHATAAIMFSANARPEGFWVRLYGTGGQVTANLFEPGLIVHQARAPVGALLPTLNGLAESRAAARSAVASLTSRLSGRPEAKHGLGALVTEVYHALREGAAPPVTAEHMRQVCRLVGDITDLLPGE